MACRAGYVDVSTAGARPVRRPIGDGPASAGRSSGRPNGRVEDRRPVNDADTSVEPQATYAKLKIRGLGRPCPGCGAEDLVDR